MRIKIIAFVFLMMAFPVVLAFMDGDVCDDSFVVDDGVYRYDPAVDDACLTPFDLGVLSISEGLFSFIPREVEGRLSFPLFTNMVDILGSTGSVFLDPVFSFASGFIPFWTYDVVYTEDVINLEGLEWLQSRASIGVFPLSDSLYIDFVLEEGGFFTNDKYLVYVFDRDRFYLAGKTSFRDGLQNFKGWSGALSNDELNAYIDIILGGE